jgi:adenine-specific DNA-methyltransferase
MNKSHKSGKIFFSDKSSEIFHGDTLLYINGLMDNSIDLIVTSPPYNIGKEYEKKKSLEKYIEFQREVISACDRILKPTGSICWQVGNFVEKGTIVPLDIVLYDVFRSLNYKMKNRIIWSFDHGLHGTKRLSGRYETICWFVKSDEYYFNLDPIRIPQKYPGKKYYKGPKAGQYSSNPLGKNPGDVWANIPNVKNNHVEKTNHPCQFPVELIERLVLSMTKIGDTVLDPFLGSGTTIIAAIKNNRIGKGAELVEEYCEIAQNRILAFRSGVLRTRPMNTPIYDPALSGSTLTKNPWENNDENC